MTKSIVDALLQLRDPTDAAETASADEAGVALDLTPAHYANQAIGGSHHYDMKLVIHNITFAGSAVFTAADFVVDVDSEAAFGDSPVEVARLTVPDTSDAPTQLEIPISMSLIHELDADAAAIRVGFEGTGGTSPTLSYGAYLTKNDGS